MLPVSIITAAFHAQDFIARTVKSVLAQTHGDWEMLIVADDGQDYRAILQSQGIRDPRLRFASTGRIGVGPGVARNIGLDYAHTPIIANLDADDAIAPNYLAMMLPAVREHGACAPAVRVIDALSGDIIPIGYPLMMGKPLRVNEMMRYCPTFAPIMFNRRWSEARWPELHYGEDLLFWLLLLEDLPAVHYVSAARYDYYFRKGSLSRPEEKTTHGLCRKREGMIAWLEQGKPNANREMLKRWLLACNEMEAVWGYQMVELDVYLRETHRRFSEVFGHFDSLCDLRWS